jgi:hypothetical protein
MSVAVQDASAIHMGHGQMVAIAAHGDKWELSFSEAGKPDYVAPPLHEIKVDAIDAQGRVHALTIGAGSKKSSVVASGAIDGARRARVMVVHGTHFHTREADLVGAPKAVAARGPHGGALVPLGGDRSVEVIAAGEGRWQLTFLSGGAKAVAPAPKSVKVEAIGPRCEDYQVRGLIVMAGPDGSTLIASGKIQDASHIRIALADGDRVETFSGTVVAG